MTAPAYALASPATLNLKQLDALLEWTHPEIPVPDHVRKASVAGKRIWLMQIKAEYWDRQKLRGRPKPKPVAPGITATEVNEWLRTLPAVPLAE